MVSGRNLFPSPPLPMGNGCRLFVGRPQPDACQAASDSAQRGQLLADLSHRGQGIRPRGGARRPRYQRRLRNVSLLRQRTSCCYRHRLSGSPWPRPIGSLRLQRQEVSVGRSRCGLWPVGHCPADDLALRGDRWCVDCGHQMALGRGAGGAARGGPFRRRRRPAHRAGDPPQLPCRW